jgi:ABC-type antimicrobial peptide transport system ATPase subunit
MNFCSERRTSLVREAGDFLMNFARLKRKPRRNVHLPLDERPRRVLEGMVMCPLLPCKVTTPSRTMAKAQHREVATCKDAES